MGGGEWIHVMYDLAVHLKWSQHVNWLTSIQNKKFRVKKKRTDKNDYS